MPAAAQSLSVESWTLWFVKKIRLPRAVRTAKFVARKQWVITGADDKHIRVYDHNTAEEMKSFEAHTDYIRRAPSALQQRDHARPSFSHQTAP